MARTCASLVAAPFAWDDGTLATLRRLLIEGKTATQIGAAIGCSRNAVIGKVSRDASLPRLAGSNGWEKKADRLKDGAKPQKMALPDAAGLAAGALKPLRSTPKQRSQDNQRTVAAIAARKRIEQGLTRPPTVVVAAGKSFAHGFQGQQGRVKLEDLASHHCRFPIDMPDGEVRYCGDTAEDTSPYCSAHALRCFNPDSLKMRKRMTSWAG